MAIYSRSHMRHLNQAACLRIKHNEACRTYASKRNQMWKYLKAQLKTLAV